MDVKTSPSNELKGLMAAVSDHGTRHLVEIEADLLQTSDLLTEAIEKLGISFMALHESVTEQQLFLNGLMLQHSFDATAARKLEVFKEKIGEEVNAAVTGLQFQDLTSQLLTRVDQRLACLKSLLHELGCYSDVVDSEDQHEKIADFLERMNRNLHHSNAMLSGGLRRSVVQQDMGAGDVELF